MKKTLRAKYISAGCLIIVGFLSFLLVTARILQNTFVERWNQKQMEVLAEEVIGEIESKDWNLANVDLDTMAFENNISVTVADDSFNILSSTRAHEVARGTLGNKSMKAIGENEKALDNTGKGFYSDFDDDNKASFIQINKIKGYGYLLIRKSVTGVNASMFVMEICFAIAAGVTLLGSILMLIWLTGKMVRPIREINRVTGQIAKLNFDEKAVVESEDELGELAQSVNVMSDRLKETMESLTQDVENRKALVRNMAHELKTPIAVIMGYAENMSYISKKQPEKLDKYCTVISNECERMDNLIRQMLEVSAYEAGGDALNRTEFFVKDLLEGVRRWYEDEFPERKGIYKEADETAKKIRGDSQVLQTGLYNLVKNAVRYGNPDGLIFIHVWEEAEQIYFSVFNEGKGIPVQEQEKIWDVFYKVDAARTRDEKSFGVGLSIVKQAAIAHGGGVFVKNLDNGVEVGFFIKN